MLFRSDVPLAEIREMLEGQRTLAEGMSQQLERLRSRRADLEEAIGFCTLLQQENGPLEQLDVEQTLARLTAREEQGVTFVNIERARTVSTSTSVFPTPETDFRKRHWMQSKTTRLSSTTAVTMSASPI